MTDKICWANVAKTQKAIQVDAEINLRQTVSMVLAGHRESIYQLCPESYRILSKALEGK